MIVAPPNPAPTPSFSMDKNPDYAPEDQYPGEKNRKTDANQEKEQVERKQGTEALKI